MAGSAKTTPLGDQLDVQPECAEVPNLSNRTSAEVETAIEDPLGVAEQRERNVEPGVVGGGFLLLDKGDYRYLASPEFVYTIAHGDQVFLARQSHEVAVKNQQDLPAAVIGQAPRPTLMVRQGEVLDDVSCFRDRHG